MADLTFYKATGQLVGFGQTWSARSGGSNFAALASKTYKVPPNALMTGTEKGTNVPYDSKYGQSPFRDKMGLGWFLWLGEANLGIHPDGNLPGTEGCIGITDPNTKDLYDLLKQHSGSGMTVEVR